MIDLYLKIGMTMFLVLFVCFIVGMTCDIDGWPDWARKCMGWTVCVSLVILVIDILIATWCT